MLRVIWCTLAATAIVCSLAVGAEEQVDALQYAKGAANWILSISREQNGVLTWPVNDSDKNKPASDLYYGMPGGIPLLAETAKEDPSGPYARALPASVAGIESMRVPEPKKPINGYWNEGICCGTAGVGEFFVDLYLATKKPDYLRAAEKMALHLAKTAERIGSGYRWVQAEDRVSPQQKDAQTGYAQGCAGIGLLFLKLSRAKRGVPIGWRLPDNPF